MPAVASVILMLASKFGKDEIKGREKVRKLDIFLLCPAVARPDLTFARTRDL